MNVSGLVPVVLSGVLNVVCSGSELDLVSSHQSGFLKEKEVEFSIGQDWRPLSKCSDVGKYHCCKQINLFSDFIPLYGLLFLSLSFFLLARLSSGSCFRMLKMLCRKVHLIACITSMYTLGVPFLVFHTYFDLSKSWNHINVVSCPQLECFKATLPSSNIKSKPTLANPAPRINAYGLQQPYRIDWPFPFTGCALGRWSIAKGTQVWLYSQRGPVGKWSPNRWVCN